MKYSDVVSVYDQLSKTPKRLEKTFILSGFIKHIPSDDLPSVFLLLQGKVFPSSDTSKIGVASQLAVKAIQTATGATKENVQSKWKDTGDLGETAADLCKSKSQMTLGSRPLTTKGVLKSLQKLASTEGMGSTDTKTGIVAELLSNASPLEAQYIIRTVLGDLRIGAASGVLRDAIVSAFFPRVLFQGKALDTKESISYKDENVLSLSSVEELESKLKTEHTVIDTKNEKDARFILNFFTDSVQNALDLTNDFGIISQKCKSQGLKGLSRISIIPGNPVKVMLYPKAKDIEDAFKQVGSPSAFEYKYDGFRLQIHRNGDNITLFTRRLENVTQQFPDVVDAIKKNVSSHDIILDTEVVGVDKKTKIHIPFQNISQRIRRKHNIEQMSKEWPVVVHVFDIIELDGKNLLSTPFIERRKTLEKVINKKNTVIEYATQIITDNIEKASLFYLEAQQKGYEGVMAKSLDGPYKPGSRVGYGVKVKPVMETLDCVVVGAEWGEGKRAHWLSSFDIAVWDGDELKAIGKVSTGLKEKSEEGLSFFEITSALQPLIVKEEARHVFVSPQIILEVQYEEIQRSPSNNSGYALRFPRVVRRRDMEKSVEDADTVIRVKELFDLQT